MALTQDSDRNVQPARTTSLLQVNFDLSHGGFEPVRPQNAHPSGRTTSPQSAEEEVLRGTCDYSFIYVPPRQAGKLVLLQDAWKLLKTISQLELAQMAKIGRHMNKSTSKRLEAKKGFLDHLSLSHELLELRSSIQQEPNLTTTYTSPGNPTTILLVSFSKNPSFTQKFRLQLYQVNHGQPLFLVVFEG